MLFNKKCPNCGARNPKDAISCATCGVPFELKQTETRKAIKNYEKTIQEKAARPNLMDADAYNTQGNRHLEQRQLKRAIADFNEAVRLDPKYTVAYGNRAIAYKLQGNKTKAISDFERFIALASDPRMIQVAKQQIKELSMQ
ncbi:MAG: tetratricopeptide repeat protein [Chloroflexota bacterium]|nr:tetratricopeptide repeat protein [Chloroflexota bacterium]